MSPRSYPFGSSSGCFPRVSGDEPDLPRAQFVEEKFSPRERG